MKEQTKMLLAELSRNIDYNILKINKELERNDLSEKIIHDLKCKILSFKRHQELIQESFDFINNL